MRIGEAIGLDDSDFDPGQGMLLVRHAKLGKHRLLPLTPADLVASLHMILRVAPDRSTTVRDFTPGGRGRPGRFARFGETPQFAVPVHAVRRKGGLAARRAGPAAGPADRHRLRARRVPAHPAAGDRRRVAGPRPGIRERATADDPADRLRAASPADPAATPPRCSWSRSPAAAPRPARETPMKVPPGSEHPRDGGKPQALDHPGRQRRLRGHLPVPDRDGLVAVGDRNIVAGNEAGAGRRAHRLQHTLIANASCPAAATRSPGAAARLMTSRDAGPAGRPPRDRPRTRNGRWPALAPAPPPAPPPPRAPAAAVSWPAWAPSPRPRACPCPAAATRSTAGAGRPGIPHSR